MKIINFNKEETPKENKKRQNNREYMIMTFLVLFMLLFMCGYFVFYLAFQSESFINSPYNRRLTSFSDKIIRGDITTRDGVVVATSKVDENGNETRIYPQGPKYAHAVGFNSRGMSGMESDYNFQLLRSHSFILNRISNDLQEKKNQGDTIVSSIDSSLQDVAYNSLGGYRGAVIAMDPKTGEILCMVSKPDFDPQTIDSNWDSISGNSESSVLLNRTTQGLYPPGSIFKILTALEYLREGGSYLDPFECKGEYTLDGDTIHCYKGAIHGVQNFLEAFSRSCNTTFASISPGLNRVAFSSLVENLYFNRTLPTKLSNVKKSVFNIENAGTGLMMQTGIGQGKTLVTPIHMLMITSAIANKGVMVKPGLLKEIVNDAGLLVSKNKTEPIGSVMTKSEAQSMREFMRYTVTNGTGTRLNSDLYTAYGKTGTAEFSSNTNEAHSWFTGFAERGDKSIAITVIMEGAGSGSEFAVPLAGKIFNTYFNEE